MKHLELTQFFSQTNAPYSRYEFSLFGEDFFLSNTEEFLIGGHFEKGLLGNSSLCDFMYTHSHTQIKKAARERYSNHC